MPQQLTGYRVFIASPGGLQSARDCFRHVLEEYNRTDAFRRGLAFIPVGWEKLAPTRGRGQEVINEILRQCDYFVLVLHDRWGTPPANDGPFSSGTEEEFHVAMQCLKNEAFPMEDMVVQFKTVAAAQLSDPGDQLKKVLAFKEKLEASRELLFGTFETDGDFAEALRTSLATWVWNHENPGKAAPPKPPVTEGQADDSGGAAAEDPLVRAAQLVSQHRLTQAETILAAAAGSGDNPAADIAYAELLSRARRKRQAYESYERGIAMAGRIGNAELEARGLLGLGRLLETMGQSDRGSAIAALERAIEGFRKLDRKADLAEAWMALGVSRRNSNEFEAALAAYGAAEGALEGLNRSDLMAGFYLGRGEVLRDLDRLAEAKADFERAIELKTNDNLEDEIPDAHAGLGAICEAMGDLPSAEAQYQRGLALFSARRNWIGIADVADHLGHILERLNKLPEALETFEESAEAFDILQNAEGAADAYLSLGRISERMGDLDGARRHYGEALSLVSRIQTGPIATDMSAQIIASLDALPEAKNAPEG